MILGVTMTTDADDGHVIGHVRNLTIEHVTDMTGVGRDHDLEEIEGVGHVTEDGVGHAHSAELDHAAPLPDHAVDLAVDLLNETTPTKPVLYQGSKN